MKQVTLVVKTDEGYLIRCKLGKKKWVNFLAVPEPGTSEKETIALAIALSNAVQ